MSIQTRRLLPRLIFAGAKLPLLDGISKYFQPKNSRPHDSWAWWLLFGPCRTVDVARPHHPRSAVGLLRPLDWPSTHEGPAALASWQLSRTIEPTVTDYRASCHGLSCQLPRMLPKRSRRLV